MSRRQIAQSIYELQSEMEQTVDRALDWRGWVRKHPMPAVGIAAAIGFYFGIR